MQFAARIKPGSSIAARWQRTNTEHGAYHGISFRLVEHSRDGKVYESGDLTEQQIARARTAPDIELIVMG